MLGSRPSSEIMLSFVGKNGSGLLDEASLPTIAEDLLVLGADANTAGDLSTWEASDYGESDTKAPVEEDCSQDNRIMNNRLAALPFPRVCRDQRRANVPGAPAC
jgi:hypothetical protein